MENQFSILLGRLLSASTQFMLDVLLKSTTMPLLIKFVFLSCGISTGLGATLNVAKPKKGSLVAVFGLGAVGLAAAEGARIAGATRIIGVNLNANRFELVKKFGVTEFVNPKDYKKPVQEVIAEVTSGGVEWVIRKLRSWWDRRSWWSDCTFYYGERINNYRIVVLKG